MNLILSIDTSCDETSAAVTDGQRVLSNVISSQINIHKKYGGVFPALAKRAHQEKIDYVINEALRRAFKHESTRNGTRTNTNTSYVIPSEVEGSLSPEINKKGIPPLVPPLTGLGRNDVRVNSCSCSCGLVLSAVAVTQGPGLAIALEVGIRKAKELSIDWQLPLIAVNHLEGHLYSCLAQNINGKPEIYTENSCHSGFASPSEAMRSWDPESIKGNIYIDSSSEARMTKENIKILRFPVLGLIVSGGHTELVLMEDHLKYQVLGETLDDACGEALDKGAKILKLGYPGGPIIERLAEKGNPNKFSFNLALKDKNNLKFSYSGLKTQLLYRTENMAEIDFNTSLNDLAASYQSACFEQVIRKTTNAIKVYQPKTVLCGGGVIANNLLRKLLKILENKFAVKIYFPQGKKLTTDNAAMIGIAAGYKLIRNDFVKEIESLDRIPRLSL